MKTYRRIEITASSRRVSVTSGEFKRMSFDEPYPPVAGDMSLRDAEAGKAIDLESADGQSVLAEVVHLLQQRQTTQM
ncbi:MAG: hypothetical protein ABIP75_04095, partial [Pyrinomonadaceae bacterium]